LRKIVGDLQPISRKKVPGLLQQTQPIQEQHDINKMLHIPEKNKNVSPAPLAAVFTEDQASQKPRTSLSPSLSLSSTSQVEEPASWVPKNDNSGNFVRSLFGQKYGGIMKLTSQ